MPVGIDDACRPPFDTADQARQAEFDIRRRMHSITLSVAQTRRKSYNGLPFTDRESAVFRSTGLLALLVLALTGCAAERSDRQPNDGDEARDSLASGRHFMGREIGGIRGHELAEWFERPGREVSELPDRLVRALELDSSDVVADVGAGTGYFTFRLSPLVPRGRVLAVDIDEQMLNFIRRRMEEESVPNIETILGSVNDPRLPENSVDVALIVDTYHEFSHPEEMLRGIHDGLREGGRLVIVEYRGEDETIDIHPLHRMTEGQIRQEVEAAGFVWSETRDFLPRQHVVVFTKPINP